VEEASSSAIYGHCLAAGAPVPHGFAKGRVEAAGAMAGEFEDNGTAEFVEELARLRQEHRDLDGAIDALELSVAGDQLQIQRLKRRKLGLRDRISYLEDQITPDIIA
jgi:hypothetical protein